MRVEVQRGSKAFGDRVLFTELNMTVCAGSTIALMGPSGAGKSTLLSILAGHERLTSGIVRYTGAPLGGKVDWIVQSSPLLDRRTAAANVALGALSRGLSEQDSANVAQAALTRVGLLGRGDERVYRLSGGERQRVAIARAIARKAAVILADEPTASLDPSARSAVVKALAEAASEGSVVIVATHDAAVASACNRRLDLADFAPPDGA